MKSFLKASAFILSSYLMLTFINMGLVMLFFLKDQSIPVLIPLIIQAFVMISCGYFVLYKFVGLFKLSESTLPLYSLILILGFVSSLNLYLNVSLEPRWFVTSNFIFVASGLIIGYRRRKVLSKKAAG